MESIQVDAQFPAGLEPLFQPYRYKVIHGGRGSSKSWSVARALVILAATKTLRILCTREIQDSIRDSVHRLLSDQIQSLRLGHLYTITRDEIRSANGSLFVFAGLASHTVESIKSFEGVDIAWIEEAQTISKRSFDVLLPTIRKDGSEVWLTLNPHLETDETYRRFIASPPANAWVKKLNWSDNPFFPQTLELERQETRRLDPDAYANIWEGEPVRVAEGAIYAGEVDALYREGRARNVPADPMLPVHTVWDLGWADSMAIALVQRSASEIRVIDYIEGNRQTLDWYVKEIERRPHRWGTDFIPHDGASKDFKTGKSTEEILRSMGRKVSVLGRDDIEEGIKQARMVFPRAYFDEAKAARLLECLKRYRRMMSKTGEASRPLHDEYSHGADCWRYVAMAVDLMKNGDKPKAAPVRRERQSMGWMG